MTSGTNGNSFIEHPLGTLGLVLIGLTAWAAERLQVGARIERVLARLVLAGVTTIGWLADRLPRPTPRSARNSRPGARLQFEPGATTRVTNGG